ncbi:hypothetical protein IJF81_02240, partial [bacterium]|nr:hypothetical protein [bacterium]
MTEINQVLLRQQEALQAATSATPTTNSHNLINVATAKEVGEIAKREIGTMPYRIATAGYSAPPEGYEY